MTHLLLASLILIATPDVAVRAVDGQRVEGQLSSIDTQHVVLDTSEGNRTLSLDTIMNLEPVAKPRSADTPELPGMARLTDGSLIPISEYATSDGRKAEMTASLGNITCSTKAIRAVRFISADKAMLDEWNRLLAESFDSDVLVTRRDKSLNYHRGIIRKVSDESVAFELDGDVLNVKRSKAFGLIYYHPAGRTLPASIATLDETSGSRLAVHQLTFKDNLLSITTPSGMKADCPLDALLRLDLSQGKLLYLSELKPKRTEWTPYFGLPKELASRDTYFSPVFDPSPKGSAALALGKKKYAQGIALFSRSELEYELPKRYRRLKALVGIDDAFRPHGSAELIIRADDRVLFKSVLNGEEPPQPIDLDVDGVTRLTILVDFGKEMDQGDRVNLCEARLVK